MMSYHVIEFSLKCKIANNGNDTKKNDANSDNNNDTNNDNNINSDVYVRNDYDDNKNTMI